jgi:hypothetical protein
MTLAIGRYFSKVGNILTTKKNGARWLPVLAGPTPVVIGNLCTVCAFTLGVPPATTCDVTRPKDSAMLL